jgi:hypothetical protein
MKQISRPRLALPALLFTCCCLVSFHAKAQLAIGLEGGYNRNYIVTNNANRAFTYYQPLSGFTIGIPVQYTINDWLAIAADPGFVKKNYRQQRGDFYLGVYQDNDNSYLQLPLMGHFMFGGTKLKGFVNLGVYGGYWLGGRVKGKMANILDLVDDANEGGSIYNYQQAFSYSEAYGFNTVRDNRLEFGWLAGLGLEYQLKERFKIFAEARLLYGVTDQQKNYSLNQVPRYNNTIGVSAGALMRLIK